MLNLNRSNFQAHPFHLVSPSPWPLYTSISLLSLTTSAVLSFHGFAYAGNNLILSLTSLVLSMSFWFRDIIAEGTKNLFNPLFHTLKIARAISKEEIDNLKLNIKEDIMNLTDNQLGYFLAGLIEGDGHLSIPAKSKTILSRILNPRIVFTGHINNIEMYILLQTKLGGIGRFQHSGNNVIRYIIGDNKGILKIIELVHGKFRTPKNITFNYLIEFFNIKYNHNIPNSPLDSSDFGNNSWLTGFVEADGYFGVKILESKPKSYTRKRFKSASINLVFRLDQRSFDTPTNTTFVPFMAKLAKFLDCSVLPYREDKVLSLSLTSLDKLTNLIRYLDKYPLIGVKGKDFKDWIKIYYMIKNKEHLTEAGKEKIMLLQSNMNSKRKI
jgi:hypothetical protein